MTSIYFNTAAPDSTAPHFDDEQPAPNASRHSPPTPRSRRLALQGALATLVFMLVYSALAMLVVSQVGYSPRLLIGLPLTYVVMLIFAWRAGRFR